MKNSRAVVAMVAIALIITVAATAGRANAAGPAAINLGSAANFSVLAGSAVTNTGPTTADKDVGVWAGTSVTGFTGPPNGTTTGTIHPGDSTAQGAQSAMTAAFGFAANAPVTANYAALGGLTLVGGVYSSGGATLGLTGTLTLDGQNDPSSVWIFRATSDLVTASSSFVSFVNGASPCNVFWRVVSSATLGSGSTFGGTILADQSITVADGVTVYGRALASIGLVSLINDRFLTSACGGPIAPPSSLPPCEFMVNIPNAPCAGTRPTPTTQASATQTPSAPTVAPAATPIVAVAPTVAPTAAAAVAPTASPARSGVQVLPSTSTNDSVDPLLMLGIALTGIGILVLRRRPFRNS
jgi:type VI secretion system secreted protein VgrG